MPGDVDRAIQGHAGHEDRRLRLPRHVCVSAAPPDCRRPEAGPLHAFDMHLPTSGNTIQSLH